MAEQIVDVLLAALLLLTVTWCVLLHQRLRGLRYDRAELAAFVDSLNGAAERAEQAVAQMRAASEEAARVCRDQQEGARRARDELGRLAESATRLARRLESEIGRGAGLLAEARVREETRSSHPIEEPARERPRPEEDGTVTRARPPRRGAPTGEALLRALAGLR